MKYFFGFFVFVAFLFCCFSTAFAVTPVETSGVVNPLDFPNNRFGIHILDVNDLEKAALLVNSTGGEWGYVTMVIRSNDRDIGKWQAFMRRAKQLKLIPLIRLATGPDGNAWKKPEPTDAKEWALFLNRLNWPVKNRYIIVYNEPNHALEWGTDINPGEYARVLKETRDALKEANPDFFVMNAGFDASAPNLSGYSMNSVDYMNAMERAVPGVFASLDGWSSHSYPNPEFSGKPSDTGIMSIRGYQSELGVLSRYGASHLPVFITETGWKHLAVDDVYGYLSEDRVAGYYREAFDHVWNDPKIVAVTPFVLGYFQEPFKQFSFLKLDGSSYSPFAVVSQLPKTVGQPPVNNLNNAHFVLSEISQILYTGKRTEFVLHFRNTGTTTWNKDLGYELLGIGDGSLSSIKVPFASDDDVIQPGETRPFRFVRAAPREARSYRVYWQMSQHDSSFGDKGVSDFLVQSALIVFDQEYRYHLEDDRAVLELHNEPIALYKPRILPGNLFYGVKGTLEGAQSSFIREAEERDVYSVSLLENRLAEVAALGAEKKREHLVATLSELSQSTEHLGSSLSVDPTQAQLHAMKVVLIKQQYVLSRLTGESEGDVKSLFEKALFASQRTLKQVVDVETAINLTAYLSGGGQVLF